MSKKILITGANSYIGVSFENYMKSFADYQIDTLDMLDPKWIEKDFSKYDSIFHVAGIAHIKETKENAELYYKVNRDLAIQVASKAKTENVKQFILLSSMSVYGIETGVITKTTKENPKSNYGKSKLEADIEIEKQSTNNFKVCIIRPPMVYGKGCKGNYQTLSKFAKKLPFFPNIENKRSMIYIENLCEFVRLMIENSEQGIFMPQNKEYTNTSQMVAELAKIAGKNIKLIKIFNSLLKLFAPIVGVINKVFGSLAYDMSISKYKEDYCIINFKESIKLTEE